MSTDIGILVLRVIIGLLLAAHGLQKISHRFGGRGLQGGIEEFQADGFRGGAITALAAGVSQVGSGLLLLAGALVPAAAMAAIGVMTVAATVKAKNGLWVQHDGYEYPLILITIASTLAFTGGGAYSIDAVLDIKEWPAWIGLTWIGLTASVLGIGAGLTARAALHAPSPSRNRM
jgi:putative oxidoreductase